MIKTGIDKDALESLERNSAVATIEDSILIGELGTKIAQFFANKDVIAKKVNERLLWLRKDDSDG